MTSCVFCKIVAGELESKHEWEDANVIAFRDVNPTADIHVLFVPKKHIEDFGDLKNDKVLTSIRKGVQELVAKYKLNGKGYKVLVNAGGAQIVPHLHFHLIGPIGKAAEV